MTEISVLELTFHQRLARLLEQSGSSRLWPALASFLQDYVTFNSWTAMIFYHDRPPTLLADGGDDWDEFDDRLYSEYISGLYVLDPFYQFAMEQYSPGIYSLRDVSPDHFIDTEYYQKYFVHNVVGDEIQFLTMLPHGGTLSLSITTRAKFTAKEIGSMNLFSPPRRPRCPQPVINLWISGCVPAQRRPLPTARYRQRCSFWQVTQ